MDRYDKTACTRAYSELTDLFILYTFLCSGHPLWQTRTGRITIIECECRRWGFRSWRRHTVHNFSPSVHHRCRYLLTQVEHVMCVEFWVLIFFSLVQFLNPLAST